MCGLVFLRRQTGTVMYYILYTPYKKKKKAPVFFYLFFRHPGTISCTIYCIPPSLDQKALFFFSSRLYFMTGKNWREKGEQDYLGKNDDGC